VLDAQRDGEYTRELAASIVESFRRHTLLQSTNLVSRAVFDWLTGHNPEVDLYRLLRTGGKDDSLALPEAYAALERTLAAARQLARDGKVRLDETVQNKDVVAVMSEALGHLASYHRRPALQRRGDRLFHQDRNLLLYYQNRTRGILEPAGRAS
jgi:hypothetical protein